MTEFDELQALRKENARLKELLMKHGIAWQKDCWVEPGDQTEQSEKSPSSAYNLAAEEKIKLFTSLFQVRTDVYAFRWESAKGKSGYSPACENEWKPGLCRKPKVKCGECTQRRLLPVTDKVIYDHLAGKHTVGVYPLLPDDTCCFLAVDFDGAYWRKDACAFMSSCRELNIPAALEISRSGNGAHIWIFFSEPVAARQARQLGTALITFTCARTRQLSLSSYDRFFPNQDTLPKGGYGNLIALPLQKQPRANGCSVFADENLSPYADQWEYLSSVKQMSRTELEEAIRRAANDRHPLDVGFCSIEGDTKPWQPQPPPSNHIAGPLPDSLQLIMANQIFIAKENLSPSLTNSLVRLAAFQNPEFYKAQAMRLPVWNKPRIIGCAENFSQHIGLPRGCLEPLLSLLKENGIQADIVDKRKAGRRISVKFTGKLKQDQKTAVDEMLKKETGVLYAPTAFGKTIIAAALIARRKVSTLVLVHRTDLLRQWQEQLTGVLDLSKAGLGALGGGKKKLSGKIDIAVMQSLARRSDLGELLDGYGHIVVDECHHISAFSFESILKKARATYVLGLTATPVRRDGHQPIIFMQCGPVRYNAPRSETGAMQMEVWPHYLQSPETPPDSSIQQVFRVLIDDSARNFRIIKDVIKAYQEGRKVLVLTERTDHLFLLSKALRKEVKYLYPLHGRMSKRQRKAVFSEIAALNDSIPRVLLATGRLIGEGFDHPPLDTLVLAMPISWKGTLQQYAGRLHREHVQKRSVRVYDYVENEHPQLSRMWQKRRRGYKAMGYEIKQPVGDQSIFQI